jgi:hypothetical protein
VLVKANALELLRRELARKRIKGYIGTGSMNDPYMPIERTLRITGQALEIIAEFRFPMHVLTASATRRQPGMQIGWSDCSGSLSAVMACNAASRHTSQRQQGNWRCSECKNWPG